MLWQGWAGGLGGVRLCHILEFVFSAVDSTRKPLRTEPCQCVCGLPWACLGALQDQMQPLQCSAGVVELALGAAAGLGRGFVGVAVLPLYGGFTGDAAQHPQCTEPCQCV